MGDFFSGGGGGSSSVDTSQLFSDASLGDAIMGGSGNIFGGGGGGTSGDISSTLGSLASALGTSVTASGTPVPAAVADPATTAAIATSPAVTGSGGVSAAGGTQSDTPAGGSDTTPNQPDQPAGKQPTPQQVLEQIRKALAQRQAATAPGANPFEPGGGGPDPIQNWENEGGAQGTPTPKPPWFRWSGGKPYSPAPWGDTDIPPIPGISAPTRAQTAGQGAVEGATAPEAPPEAPAVQPPAAGEGIQGLPAPGEASSIPGLPLTGAGILPSIIAGLPAAGWKYGDPALKQMSVDPRLDAAGTGGFDVTQPLGADPAAQPARPVTPTPATAYQPPALGGGPGNEEEAPTGTSVTTAPATGKKVETVDPKTKKPVDPKTGDPLPTKKSDKLPTHTPLPTHKGGPEAPPPGSIMGDALGFTGANPAMLGQLAKLALPLMMMAMSGGFGGGRRSGPRFGRFGPAHGGVGGRFGGFEGGRRAMGGGHGPLPAFRGGNLPPGHYPNQQGGFHYHPGGYHEGWPAHEDWRANTRTVETGGGMNPMLMAAMLGGGGGQQGGQPSARPGGPAGGAPAGVNPFQPGGGVDVSGNFGGTPVTQSGGEAPEDDILATIRQRESGGRNIQPWAGHSASGIYQIKPETWAAWARDSGDTQAQQYSEAWQAPPEVQHRLAKWALEKYGANATYTWAASGPDLGRPYPSIAKGGGGGGGGGTQIAAPKGPPITTSMGPIASNTTDTGAYSPSPLT